MDGAGAGAGAGTGIGKQEKVWLVVVTGNLERKQADAKVEAAIAEYRAAHPECSEEDINTISVVSEKAKGLLDIPEARNQLTKCNEQYINDNAETLLQFLNVCYRYQHSWRL